MLLNATKNGFKDVQVSGLNLHNQLTDLLRTSELLKKNHLRFSNNPKNSDFGPFWPDLPK